MQVLQWIFKVPQDHSKKIKRHKEEEESKEVVCDNHQKRVVRKSKEQDKVTALEGRSNVRNITFSLRRENNPRSYFSTTIEQRRLSSFNHNNHIQKQQYILSMKMIKKEDIVRGLGLGHSNNKLIDSSNAHHVGNKVLPITDSSTATSSSSSLSSSLSSLSLSRSNNVVDDQCQPCNNQKVVEKVKGSSSNKTKTLSRMKELLRWAAAAKSEKGGRFGRKVLHFRNKSATIKSGGLDEESNNNDSPKISFRWEVESCKTTCSVASAPPSLKYDQCSSRRGSWITTDDEFVVLEL